MYIYIICFGSGKIVYHSLRQKSQEKVKKKKKEPEMTAYKCMNKRKGSRLSSISSRWKCCLISYVEHPHPSVRWNDGLLKRHWINLHRMTSFSASGSPQGLYLMHCCQCSVIEHLTKPNKTPTPPKILLESLLLISYFTQSVQMETTEIFNLNFMYPTGLAC